MATKRHTSLDRVLGRLDTLDSVNLANLVQRLARERGLFEDIFNALQEGVLVINTDGVIEYANASAHRLIGLGDDVLAGETLWRLVPGLRPSLEAAFGDADGGTDCNARPDTTRKPNYCSGGPAILNCSAFKSDDWI